MEYMPYMDHPHGDPLRLALIWPGSPRTPVAFSGSHEYTRAASDAGFRSELHWIHSLGGQSPGSLPTSGMKAGIGCGLHMLRIHSRTQTYFHVTVTDKTQYHIKSTGHSRIRGPIIKGRGSYLELLFTLYGSLSVSMAPAGGRSICGSQV